MSDPGNVKPIVIASDHAGFRLKEQLKSALEELGFDHEDLGTADESSCDYPDFAHAVAKGVLRGRYDFGVLVCGTGIGMSCAANRHRGIRAALCTDSYAARMAREHNDANVLCIGARIVGPGLAGDILRTFLQTRFEGGRHGRRIAKIDTGLEA